MEANHHLSRRANDPIAQTERAFENAGHVQFPIYRRFMGVYACATALSLGITLLVLGGYAFAIPTLYQPFAGGPGTHVMTAICALVMVSGLRLWQPYQEPKLWIKVGYAALVFFAVKSLIVGLVPVGSFEFIAKFNDFALGLFTAETTVRMGGNTAFTFLLLAGSQVLRRRFAGLALLAASLAPIFALSALMGHALNLDLVHGDMSLPTISILFPLSLANGLTFAHVRAVRVLLSDSALGNLGRIQFLTGAVVPLFLGGMFTFLGEEGISHEDMAYFVVSMIWFVCIIVVFSVRAHEFTERERRRNERKLARASVTDPLTGASNRLGASLRASQTGFGAGSGVILMDLDNFKTINDTFGHSVGDRVLVEATDILRGGVRANDVLARWGGEEFLIVLGEAGLEVTLNVAERLRQRIHSVVLPDVPLPVITASFGVSMVERGDISIEAAINRADEALYSAKDQGRDRVARRIADFATLQASAG